MVHIPTIHGDDWGMVDYCYTGYTHITMSGPRLMQLVNITTISRLGLW